MIRVCTESDFETIYEIINDAAQAYKGIIPADRWHEPYMSREALRWEIDDGVQFSGLEREGELLGVMGLQDRSDVALIRHAYVRTASRGQGIGTALLRHLEDGESRPTLIGTWKAATWAIRFYEKNGCRLVTEAQKHHWLRQYWFIPERQVETSVVLASSNWAPDE